MEFGKKMRVGNFEVLKFTRSLTKNQLSSLRKEEKIPKEISRQLTRAGVPFIKVTAMSGMWGVEFAIGTTMFSFIDETAGNLPEMGAQGTLLSVFTMMYADTTVFGDKEYWRDKNTALSEFLERKKPSEEDEEEALQDVKHAMDIEEMAEAVEKEEGGEK